jgi:hypothetical protein
MADTEQTWRGTEIELEYLKSVFVRLHEIGEKNWNDSQRQRAKDTRRRCVELCEYRYYLLRKKTDV